MKVWAWVLVGALAVPSMALARGKRGGGGGAKSHYDASMDFSKHFDDEVKYDREHPQSDDDGAPASKKRKSHHKKKHSAPPPEPQEAQQ